MLWAEGSNMVDARVVVIGVGSGACGGRCGVGSAVRMSVDEER